MENVNTKFGPNYQSVCPVTAGHLQQALPCFFYVDISLGITFKEDKLTDLSLKAPTVLSVCLKTQMSNASH